jgi:hypothetical protein
MSPRSKIVSVIFRVLAAILFLAAIAVSIYLPPVFIIGKISGLVILAAIAAVLLFIDFPLFGPALFLALAYFTRTLFEARLGIFFAAPLAVYIALVVIEKPLRRHSPWLALGRIGRGMWLCAALVVLVASGSIYLWVNTTHPDLTDITSLIPDQGTAMLLLWGLGFALVNAIVEEAIFRGILYDGFTHIFKSEIVTNIFQAALFGLAHLYGIPRGWPGVGLAFVYGLLLGSVRYYTRGLLLPVLIHAAADLTIYLILLDMIGKI